MHFTTILAAAALSASTAFAAPATNGVSMMASAPQWTIERMKRICNPQDTSCTWVFGVQENLGQSDTWCVFEVKGSPASQTGSQGNVCGPYTVSSGWSGQFGPGQGFTVLSVIKQTQGLIAYPGYTDNELASGQPVVPDKAFPAQKLPQ